MKKLAIPLCLAVAPALGHALDEAAVLGELRALKARIAALETMLARERGLQITTVEPGEQESTRAEAASTEELAAAESGIDVGGAVRFQYSFEDYNPANRERSGDLDLDTIRVNFDGSIGEVLLSAELRYYQYMEVVHHAWVGYQFDDAWQIQAGITKVPFGVMPYNSHNFFFDSTYYVGLEDDYDSGVKLLYSRDAWDIRLAFFKNDELGGVDGFVSDRTARYSFDIVGERAPGEGLFAAPTTALAEGNTVVGRFAYTLDHRTDASTELGISLLRGELYGRDNSAGDYDAQGLHLDGSYGRWNLQLQAARYDYNLDSGTDLLAVGAYAFDDTIPATAELFTANLAYSVPVSWGPVTNLTFYSDNSLMTGKSGGLDDTRMNILGMAVTAGGLYTYFDLVSARNQPFIGGTLAGDADDRNTRFNINVGYYF